MAKFEAHITCPAEKSEEVKAIGEMLDWKFSAIDADPVLWPGTKCYLSAYQESDVIPEVLTARHLHRRMVYAENTLLMNEVPVVRTKIERIIFDSKTGVNEID